MMAQDARRIPASTSDELQARLWHSIEDLRAGRITPAEARKVTKEVRAELRIVETALRMTKVARRIDRA